MITEITVRLYPQPEAISAATCSFPSIAAAVRTTIEIIQLGVPIARCELLDAHTVRKRQRPRKLGLPEQPMLLMEFHGSPAGVKEQARDGRGDRQRQRRQGLRVGDARPRSAPALDGAAQRILCCHAASSPAAG